MSDTKLTVTGLTTDLRRCAAAAVTAYGALRHAHVLTTAGADAYVAASDGRCLAVAEVRAVATPGPAEVPLPAHLALGKAGKDTTLALNGEWQREERGRRGAPRVTAAAAVGPDETGRVPDFGRVLPDVGDGWRQLRLDARSLAALADALSEDGVVTLLLPPAGGRTTGGVVAVLGAAGFGAIAPCGGGLAAEAECARYNDAARKYREARAAALAAPAAAVA